MIARSFRLTVCALAALTMTTAACGARWSDEQAAEVATRASAEPTVAAAPTADVAGSPVSTTVTVASSDERGGGAGPTTTSVGARPSADATAEQAPRTGGNTPDVPAAALPCTAPSSAPGVTDDTISIGSISSLSGPVPGLGASSAAAARAYVAYRNATGGVCGRTIELKEADDGTDNGRYRSVVGELGPRVLGLAGGFALGDVGGVDVIAAQKLPIVNVPSADAVQELPTAFDMNPPYADPNAVIGKYRYVYDHGARKVSQTYLAVDQSRAEAQVQRRLMEAAGLKIVQTQELPISTLSYDSAARSVANSGADYLFFIGDVNANGSMARSMADTGYPLKFAEYFTFAYGTEFTDLAGPAAEGAVSWLRTLPNEDASRNAEIAAFVEWMDRVAPGDAKDVFAADSWTSVKAFLDTLEALPGPISRQALMAQLGATGSYDAGGMMGPIELGAEQTHGCFVAVQVRSGPWQRLTPDQGFLC